MASGILARRTFEQLQTRFVPTFSEREYAKWVATYQDIPEHIVTLLAESRDRNDFEVASYVRERERYGRTIIFADRWYQCDYCARRSGSAGARDVVYSHVAVDRGGRGRAETAGPRTRTRECCSSSAAASWTC
jgi:hypothetical protein